MMDDNENGSPDSVNSVTAEPKVENGGKEGTPDSSAERNYADRQESSGKREKSNSESRSKSRHSKNYRRRSRSTSKERRSRSRSRSRSHYRKRHSSRSKSRSRSRSNERRQRDSRSPVYGASRYGNRDAPAPSRCLGVFGMSLYTDEKQLRRYFSQFGEIESVQIIYDRQTRRSRGFGFVYFERTEDAVTAKEQAIGTEIDGQRVRIDFSISKGPHNPTPGMYMGRRRDHDDHGRYGSPPRRRRSRSYSYSPRR